MPTTEIIFEQVPIALFYTDLDACMVRVNNAFVEMTGIAKNEVEGKSLFSIFPEAEARMFSEDNLEVIKTKVPKKGIIESVTTPKGIMWFRTDKVPHIVDGKVVGVIGFALDITKEKLLEEKTAHQSNLFDMLFDPCALIDEKGNIEDINPAAEKLLGYQEEELIGQNLNILIAPEDRHLFKDFIGTGNINVFPLLFKGLKKDGSVYYGEVSSTPYFDIGNKRLSASLVRDLTDRNSLTEKILYLSKAIEYSPSTIVMVNLEGNITYVNPRFSEVTGYHYKEVVGKNPRILKSGKMPPKQYAKMWAAISNGDIWRGEFLNRTKDGSLYWEIASIAPVKDQYDKIISYVKVAEVVTDLKQTIVNLWNILDYSNYFILVLNKELEIRLCNHMLSTVLGYKSEEEMVGKNWLEYIPEGTVDITKFVHNDTLEKKSGAVESTGEIISADGTIIVVKWFHSYINSEFDWVFSMGVPFKANEQKTIENVRDFYREVLAKDKTTIEAIKKRVYNAKTG